MMELFSLYSYAFILVPLAGSLLGILGPHLIARKKGLELLSLSQAALFGSIIGGLFEHLFHFSSLIISIIFYLLIKLVLFKNHSLKGPFYLVIYLGFIALTYFVVMLFPNLDTHMSTGLFGDIVSLSQNKSILLIIILIFLYLFYLKNRKVILKSTLENALLNKFTFSIQEEILFFLTIILSLYGLGFLFTLSFLIIPVVLIGNGPDNYKKMTFFYHNFYFYLLSIRSEFINYL